MQVRLEYGRTGLDVTLPDDRVVKCLGYGCAAPVADPDAVVRRALMHPHNSPSLAAIARGCRSACVVISDVTRPVPNQVILPPLLGTLEASGVPREKITVLIGTGLHRPNLGQELAEMVGPKVMAGYRIENHDGHDRSQHVHLGVSPRGVPLWIDRRYVEAQLKITTGLIEPHFMAGFSGGRKAICPGIAAVETVRAWHSPRFLEHPDARCGRLEGNPVHEEVTWIARRVGCDFIVNAVMNERREILALFAGHPEEAFWDGTRFVRRLVTDVVPRPVDIVVTCGAGYPLDTTFYQCVKGMVGAMEIVKPGGTIILAAGMEEGVGSAPFQRLFEENASLDAFMHRIQHEDYFVPDQWQLEELAKVRRKAKVKVITQGLPPEKIARLFVESAPTVEQAVADSLAEYGPQASIAVIPKGPYVLAEVAR